MKDHYKTKRQLIAELRELRRQLEERASDSRGGDDLARRNVELENDACVIVRRTQRMEALAQEIRRSNERLGESNEALLRRERYLSALAEVDRILLACRDEAACLPQVLRLLGEASEADRAYKYENLTGPGGELLLREIAEWCAPDVPSALDSNASATYTYEQLFLGWKDVVAGPGYVAARAEDLPASAAEVLRRYGVSTILALPIVVHDEFVGFIGFDSLRERVWEPSEIDLLRSATSAYSMMMERQSSERALAHEGAIHHTLADLAGALISSATVSEISRLVLSRARRLTGSAAGFVGYIDPKSGYFVCPALEVNTENPFPAMGREVVFRRTHGLWGRAIERCEVLRLNPPLGARAADGLPEGLPVPESFLAVPARIADEVLGLIVLLNAPDVFTPADESLLLQLASLYAVALERSRAETRTRESVIMEMATNLAAGVAHDFNNLMVGVMGYAELLRMDLAGDPEKLRMLDVIVASARRAGDLAHQMLAFSGGGTYSPRLLSLNSVVANALRHSSAVPETVELQLELEPQLWDTEADSAQISQIVEHLCANAVEAMDARGSLLVSTSNTTLGGREADGYPSLRPGDYVCLTVEDTGCGMDRDTQAKMFEPFYTTKFQGRGLGLSAVYGIVKNHGGGIAFYSEPGGGSVFRVYLPARRVVDPAAEPDLPGGNETVLIVDDEEMVLSLTRRGLEQWGYRVLEARDGREALHVAETHAGEIDLVLLDLGMPVMGGRETLPRLRELLPDARTIVCSGYGQQSTIQEMLAAGADDFIVKPFRLESLASAVRRQLDRV